MQSQSQSKWWIVALELGALIVIALVLRLGYVQQVGYVWDTDQFQLWGETARDSGLFTVYANQPRLDYPPLYLAVLSLGFTVQQALQVTPLAVLKFGPILGDIGLIVLAYVAFYSQRWLRVVVPLALALLPGIIATSAFWGQVDSLWTFFLVLSAMLVKRKRFGWAWAIYAVALLTKFQAIVFLPVIGWLTLLELGWRKTVRPALLFVGVMAFGLLPFVLGSGPQAALRPYLESVGRYNYLTMNAMNPWMLGALFSGEPIASPDYPMLPDDEPLLAGLTGRHIGLALLAGYTLLVLWSAWRQRGKDRTFVIAGALYMGFFILPTQIHERYLYPAMILSIFAIAEDRRMAWVAVPLALTYTYNVVAIALEPFSWLGLPLLFIAGEIGLGVSLFNLLLLFAWTVYLLLPPGQPRRMKRVMQWTAQGAIAAVLVGFTVSAILPDPLPAMRPLNAQFDNGIELIGYEVHQQDTALDVVLFWRTTEPVDATLYMFVRASADGARLTQDDSAPAIATNRWTTGDVFTTRHTLALTNQDDPALLLTAGLYDSATLRKLDATQDGAPAQGDLIALGVGGA